MGSIPPAGTILSLLQVNLLTAPSEPPHRTPPLSTPLPDLLLVNPVAGGGLGSKILSGLQQLAVEHHWPIEIAVTASPDDFTQKARQAACAGHRRIFAVGGDGTFQVLLNALQDAPQIVLGVIPAGGGNDLAAALGLPDDPLRAAIMLIQGEVCELDAVRVRTSEGHEVLYTGGGGVGLDAEASRFASTAYRNFHGRLRYLLSAVRALAGFHAFQTTITTGPEEVPLHLQKALVACVLNTPSYGAGLALAPEAVTDDGRLDLVLLEDLSLWEIVSLLPSLAFYGQLNTVRMTRRSVTHVRIQTDPPRSFHGDGEILGTTPVEISVVPRACRVLRAPRPSSSFGPTSGST
ncbi:MAG TPA: diacylglycerol kinase family protein [Methylomirabilota bacterium]|nr:diacylglycerol kinase family protein [Methylomirabilota bacterium]